MPAETQKQRKKESENAVLEDQASGGPRKAAATIVRCM